MLLDLLFGDDRGIRRGDGPFGGLQKFVVDGNKCGVGGKGIFLIVVLRAG